MRYSNCLLAAVAAWLRDPKRTRIHFMRIRMVHLHWFWETRGEFWHFTTDRRLTFCRELWFRGEVREFPETRLKRLRNLRRLPDVPVTAMHDFKGVESSCLTRS
jgi:hypothetical protein